jgi:CDP-diacylglycerol--glycerol-3-phosphate 3-phosphatidyltransferase
VRAAPPDHVADPVRSRAPLNLPNSLTLLRLLLVPVFVWLLLRAGGDNAGDRVAAAIVFVIAGATDFADGWLARRQGLVTNFGKIADPIADKALTGAALICLSALNDLPWWVTVVILVRELAVTALRFWVIRFGVIPASRGGKVKTAAQLLAILLYVLPVTGWLLTARTDVLAVAVVLTVVTGLDYVVRAGRLRRVSQPASEPSPAPVAPPA